MFSDSVRVGPVNDKSSNNRENGIAADTLVRLHWAISIGAVQQHS